MRVVLTGFRGTGKTEIGRLLAHLLGVPFLDTDAMVEEQAGRRIHDIFAVEGEKGFRAREREAIASLTTGEAVISTGGGAVIDPQNVEALRRGSVVVLLTADEATIEKRIRNTSRPPLTSKELREEIRELLELRKEGYLSASDFCVDTSTRSANEAALFVKRLLTEGTSTAAGRAAAVEFIQHAGIRGGEVNAFASRMHEHDRNPALRVYGIAGNPCTHSRSPELFNQLFAYFGINAFYTRFQDPSIEYILRVAAGIGLRGLSVTIPFKQAVMEHLDAADAHSQAIGACNTVLFCGGEARGYNTDWLGIREPLTHREGARAVILGAGGAAAAAVYALQSLDMEVTVLNRTVERAAAIASRFGCRYGPLSAFDLVRPGVVINATPVGMEPDRRSPLSPYQLREGMTVFDLVYTPPETPLIRQARNAGCEAITGTEMFVRQARAQFRHFTGIEAPLSMVRKVLA
jgi:shikimate dehydrogenase